MVLRSADEAKNEKDCEKEGLEKKEIIAIMKVISPQEYKRIKRSCEWTKLR
jgi:hypothetical protein